MARRRLLRTCQDAIFLAFVCLLYLLIPNSPENTSEIGLRRYGLSLNYLLQPPPQAKMDEVDRLTPAFQSTYLTSLRDSFAKISGASSGLATDNVSALVAGPSLLTETDDSVETERRKVLIAAPRRPLGELLDKLLRLMTTPKRKCRKLVRVGGYSCRNRPEGAKNLCLDEDVKPVPFDCLVYSFGVGHDLSFDAKAVNYGCGVYAFDADKTYKNYTRKIVDDLAFVKVRLGPARYIQNQKTDNGFEQIVYRPLHQIIKYLKHQNAAIDILKIDIEGEEWKVFEKSVFKTKILERIKQISLEFHLDNFKEESYLKNKTKLLEATKEYLRVLEGLEARGFRLAHFEPNYRGTKVMTLENITFHIFSETLWINPLHMDHMNEDFMGNFYHDYVYPPKELLQFTRPPIDFIIPEE